MVLLKAIKSCLQISLDRSLMVPILDIGKLGLRIITKELLEINAMRGTFFLAALLLWAASPPAAISQQHYDGPIIDMHLHAYQVSSSGDYNAFWLPEGVQSPKSTEQLMKATFAEMKRFNIVKGWASGPVCNIRWSWRTCGTARRSHAK
jgi:hypothetical protein